MELILDKIHEKQSICDYCDFKAKSNNWCKADIPSLEYSITDTILSSYGLNQII